MSNKKFLWSGSVINEPPTLKAAPVVHLEPIAGRTDTNATIDITLVEPSPLELRCSASGAPTPILSWTLNGRTLLSTARVHNLVLAPLADGNVIVINELGNIVNESWSLEVPPHRQGRVQRVVRSDGGGVMVTLALRMGADEKKVSGNYTCSAVNAVGKDERVFRLSVLGEIFPRVAHSGCILDRYYIISAANI